MQYPRHLSVRLFAIFITCCFAVAFTGISQAQIVAFGASNVAGRGVFPNQAWPAVLENLLKAKGYNVQVKNAGISGDTTSHMLQRVDSSIPAGTKIVILDMGGGFFNNKKSDIPHAKGEADMKAIAARLKARGIRIIPIITGTMPTTLKQPDRVHLTVAGHQAFAQQLLPRVVDALASQHSS
jgi:acyl-CoA thioesterase I